MVCGRMCWWWGCVGVDWYWMVSSSSISFCASDIPKYLWNVFQFTCVCAFFWMEIMLMWMLMTYGSLSR